MSNIERIENLKQIVKIVQPAFEELAVIHKAVNYKREASFALQILSDNQYLQRVALENPDSFKRAIINVAAVGLTLSPVHKFAYLVPRDGKVCLDIGYRGYVQLAADAGAIRWCKPEIVRKKDKYTYKGMNAKPKHEFEAFGDRGEVIGVYAITKMPDGEILVDQMRLDEVYAIRDRTAGWRAYVKDKKTTPWNTDEEEMIKKTLIRRAWKSWPLTDKRDRLEKAIEVSDEADPIELQALPPAEEKQTETGLAKIRTLLKAFGRTESDYIDYLVRANQRDLKKLEDLTPLEISKSIIMLEQTLEQHSKKAEVKREKAS